MWHEELPDRFTMFDTAWPMRSYLYDRSNGRGEFVLSRPEAIAAANRILVEEAAAIAKAKGEEP